MRKLKSIFLLTSIFIITVAFNFQHNPPSGWYQQFLPSLGSGNIVDMTFTDSLNGYIVTDAGFGNNNYILKTTNGGDNWNIILTDTEPFVKVKFINQNTGFTNAFQKIYKTTNAGINWSVIILSGDIYGEDMSVLNQDTIWLTNHGGLTGGVFRTTNGGVNWTQQLSLGSQNPTRIYFYNARIGFITDNPGFYIRKTTNSGVNWSVVVNNEGFTDIHFVDSLTGWCSYGSMKKTTDGGISWTNQTIPQGGYIVTSVISQFSVLNKDTIWGVGGYIQYPNFQKRGMIYTTTNGGNNWLYQVPDTSQVNVFRYTFVQFINKNYGWTYFNNIGIHTKIGGDPLTAITHTNSQIPSQYNLGQNYPNPFNPSTAISYEISKTGFISIKVYDIRGKEIAVLVNEKKNAGSYEIIFNAQNLTSGIYFYSLSIDNKAVETKKMMLVK